MDSIQINRRLKGLFIIFALECLVVCILLFMLPKDPNSSVMFGMSFQRLLMTLTVLVVGASCFGIAFKPELISKPLDNIIGSDFSKNILLFFFIALSITAFSFSQIPVEMIKSTLLNAYQRIQPILYLIWITSLQFVIFLFLISEKTHSIFIQKYKKEMLIAGGTGLTLIIIFIIMQITRFGVKPDVVGWGKATPPILSWQIWLSLAISIVLYLVTNKLTLRHPKARKYYIFIPVLIYICTVIIWLNQPTPVSYFAPRVRSPNFEIYPYSDAGYYYASAENILTGNGLLGFGNERLLSWQVAPRPFYISILAYFIYLTHGDYSKIIVLQTLLLALIPVVGYFIGKKMHGYLLGNFIAFLLIFKEINTIQATKYLTTSNSKLLLADLPTQLIVLGLAYILIMYFRSEDNKNNKAIIVGGSIGLAMLFRTQTVLFLPFFLVLDLIHHKKFTPWVPRAILMFFGTLLVISPWMIRNLVHTGNFTFDHQIGMVSGRYQLDTKNAVTPDEDNLPSEGGINSVINVIFSNPKQVISFFGAHFLNNELTSLMTFAPQSMISSIPYLFESTKIWNGGELILNFPQIIMECLILLIITCGYILAYKRIKLAGLIPLVIQTVYHVSNSLARNSGGRYTIPVDWVNCVYFAAGILQIGIWFMFLINPKLDGAVTAINIFYKTRMKSCKPNPVSLFLLVGVVLVGIGCFIPITEYLFTINNHSMSARNVRSGIFNINTVEIPEADKVEINTSILENHYQVIQGLALYPRFYPSNQGEPGSNWAAYTPMPTCRMGFILLDGVGEKQAYIYLRRPPTEFPSQSNAIVIGSLTETQSSGYYHEVIKVKYVIITGDHPIIVRGLENPISNCRNH
jgi:hypothetical protein